MSKNPVMNFPIKKRINTELFIEISAEIYIQNGKRNFMADLKSMKVGAKTNNRWEWKQILQPVWNELL